jgi:hypothetical protein
MWPAEIPTWVSGKTSIVNENSNVVNRTKMQTSTARQTSMFAPAGHMRTTGGALSARSRLARLSAVVAASAAWREWALLQRQNIVGTTPIRVGPEGFWDVYP